MTTLIARMGDVRLMELDDGDLILKKLVDAVGGDETIFTIDMTGNQLRDKYVTLPISIRKAIDVIAILDQSQWMNMLKDIQRITETRATLSQKNDTIIEAYLSNIVWTIVISVIATVLLYRCSTMDIKGAHDGIAKIALGHVVENIAEEELNGNPPATPAPTVNVNVEPARETPETDTPPSGS